jgi:predicted transcriptional regulator
VEKGKMTRLTPKEEEIMQALWKLGQAFVKDILELLPEPKPHYNTVSTAVRKLEAKGLVGHEAFGPTHRYFPILKKEDYLEALMSETVESYFDNSFKEIVSYFAKKEKISPEELKEIIRIIEQGKNK